MFSETRKQLWKQNYIFPKFGELYKVNFCTFSSHWMLCKEISGMKTNNFISAVHCFLILLFCKVMFFFLYLFTLLSIVPEKTIFICHLCFDSGSTAVLPFTSLESTESYSVSGVMICHDLRWMWMCLTLAIMVKWNSQFSIGWVEPGKMVHFERWGVLFRTLPVGLKRSIQF